MKFAPACKIRTGRWQHNCRLPFGKLTHRSDSPWCPWRYPGGSCPLLRFNPAFRTLSPPRSTIRQEMPAKQLATCGQCRPGGRAKREMDTLCEVPEVGHRQFAIAPSATGAIARLAYAHAKKAGIALPPLLSRSGLTIAQIENRHLRLEVKSQITFLGLVADALGDNLLGFHLAQDF